MTTSGTAAGPYPGTFTETVTATMGPQPDGFGVHLISLDASFTIDSAVGQVSGTKSLFASDGGICKEGDLVVGTNGVTAYTGVEKCFAGTTTYEATITAPDGDFVDSGRARTAFCYTQTAVLNDDGRCCLITSGSYLTQQFLVSSGVESVGPGDPASLTLTPPFATNEVGTQHTVTARVADEPAGAGEPNPDAQVVVNVSGSSNASGTCTTGADGTCTFTYTGPQLPGADIIVACVDTDEDGVRDAEETVCGEATKAWVLPTSTPGQVTGGGQILDPGDSEQVAFGFNAQNTAAGLRGNCTVVDAAPTRNVKIKCLSVDVLVQTATHATFFGQAEVNGLPTDYRIDVDDNGEPGRGVDTFKIVTGSGYSAAGVLDGGNIQIHGT